VDAQVKQQALRDAIALASVAFGTSAHSSVPYHHGEACAEFLETMYRTLCELYSDAITQE